MRFCRVTASRNSSSGVVVEKARVEVAFAHVRCEVVSVVLCESSVSGVDNMVVIAAVAGGSKAV
jgi:hypothetical protein